MYLSAVTLEEFRSYQHQHLHLPDAGLCLFGANASGKSTLLEAIAMLATTRSSRTTTERELIRWESGDDLGVPPFARIGGTVVRDDQTVDLEIALVADPARPAAVRKQIKVNRRPVRAMDAVGTLNAVLFSPEDVSLVSGSPAARRRYLDLTISQLDGRYLRALSKYNRILEQRNSLLKSLQRSGIGGDSPVATSQLAFWDEELVAYGAHVLTRRLSLLRKLAGLAAVRFAWLTGAGTLALQYAPTVDPDLAARAETFERESDLELVVARAFALALETQRRDELRRGVSLVGPHRDDFTFSVDGVGLGSYGSRGQQRLAVVALKLAEADLMLQETDERPVVLLDDVLSELDPGHRRMLTDAITRVSGQVILTTTDRDVLDEPGLRDLPRARVERGTIQMDHADPRETDDPLAG